MKYRFPGAGSLLQGRWVCETLDTGGGPQADGETWLEVTDGKLSTARGGLKGHVQVPSTLDPSQTPKRIDLVTTGVIPVVVGGVRAGRGHPAVVPRPASRGWPS